MKKAVLPILGVCLLTFTYPIYASNYYSQELQNAYSWAYSKNITTMPTIERANMNGNITRAEMAKMIANYAENVLGQKPNTTKECSFSDVDAKLDSDYDNWITESCQLGLMGQWITKFRPNDSVSRAEFWTILSRALWWDKNEWWSTYYENHLKALQEVWIMNNTSSPNSKEIRWYVMLMMKRSADKDNNQTNNWDNQTPLEKPDWDNNFMPWDGQTPPEKPNWEMSSIPGSWWMQQPQMIPWSGNQMWMPWDGQTPPEKPDGDGWQWMPWGMLWGMPWWNQSSTSITYNWANTISSSTTASNKTYSSSTASENALLVEGWDSTLTNITVEKTWDSDWWDSADFYWTNAAVLVKNWTLAINNSTITSNAAHWNAVFAYGEWSITISDSTITTKKDTSWWIMVTWWGKLVANNLTVTTAWNSSAPIRSDRGGGTLTVNWWTYTSNWQGSPAVYSTADITVNDATLVSNVSEGIVVEGKNSVTLNNVNLIASNTKLNWQSTTYKAIFLYQSVSWDAEEWTAEFEAKDSKITVKKWDTIYVTNTSAKITLENNTITNSVWDFLRIEAWAWWKSGSNGWNVTLKLVNQDVDWDIVVDSISSLTMNITNGSNYEWAINTANQSQDVTVTLDPTSTWTLTADTYITTLNNNWWTINYNGYKLVVANN